MPQVRVRYGMPGTLPALNEKVVEYCIRAGLALDMKIHQYCNQHRKHYFYPDLSKAFQTSQFDLPLCYDGYVDLEVPEGDPLDGVPETFRGEALPVLAMA